MELPDTISYRMIRVKYSYRCVIPFWKGTLWFTDAVQFDKISDDSLLNSCVWG